MMYWPVLRSSLLTSPSRLSSFASSTIETRDAKRCDTAKGELLAGGGRLKVPCLRVVDAAGGESWMYESKDIIDYLEGRFAGVA